MQVLIICELVAIFLVTAYLLNHYAAKGVNIWIKMAVFIAWFICFLTIGLVPIDVYYSYTAAGVADDTGFDSPPEILQMAWRAVYWSSFFLSWIGLPLLQEYENAGEFTPKEKLKKSIKLNLIFYAVLAVLGAAFILYLVISQKMGKEGIFQFFITFSNIFGIFLIILCLGFGLVQIPKRYLQKTNKQVNLKYYQFHIAECDEEKTSLKVELEDLLKLIHLLSLRKDAELDQKALLNIVMNQCTEEFIANAKRTINSLDHNKANEYGEITQSKIVALNKDVKKKIAELQRLDNKYESTLREAILAQSVIECKTAEEWSVRNSNDSIPVTMGTCARMFNWIEWAWYTKAEQIFFLVLGIFFACCSVAVFVDEILTFDNINIFSIQTLIGDSFFKSQIVCLIPLLYISLCVFSSLFDMKLGGIYGLYPHHTDSASLIFASLNFSRVSTPLVFNFLQMNKLTQTNFNTIMGDASLAYSFVQYFPLLLIFLILGQLFDVYGRLMNWIGLSRFRFSENFNDERIEEGRVILMRAHKGKSNVVKERSYSIQKMPNEESNQTINTKLLVGRSPDTSSDYTDYADLEDSMNRSRLGTRGSSFESKKWARRDPYQY